MLSQDLQFEPPRLASPGIEVSNGLLAKVPFSGQLKVIRNKRHFSKNPQLNPMSHFDPIEAIFIRIPKNASNSIVSLIYPGTAPAALPHFGAEFYQRLFPAKYEKYLSFAPIRNPLKRLTSAFTYYREVSKIPEERKLMDEDLSFLRTLEDFVSWINDFEKLSDVPILRWHHFRLQRDYICNRDGKVITDLLFPVEDMTRGLEFLKAYTGRGGEVGQLNPSREQDFDHLPLDRIRQHYADDFKLWEHVHSEKIVFATSKMESAQRRIVPAQKAG